MSLRLFTLLLLEYITSNDKSLFHLLEHPLHFLPLFSLHSELLIGLFDDHLLLLLLLEQSLCLLLLISIFLNFRHLFLILRRGHIFLRIDWNITSIIDVFTRVIIFLMFWELFNARGIIEEFDFLSFFSKFLKEFFDRFFCVAFHVLVLLEHLNRLA
jgi:hypothetical protein